MELITLSEIVVDAVSSELIDDAVRLARQVNEFRPLKPDLMQKVRREILGERVFNSNAIEGNTFTLRETLAILDTGKVVDVGRKREGQEVLNLGKAIEKSSELVQKPQSVGDQAEFLNVHRILLTNVDDQAAGVFRREQVMIRGARHQPPDAGAIPALMSGFFSEVLVAKNVDPIVAATWAHWIIARIHPFKDGNGRMARLWQDLILFSHNLTAGVIRESERKVYYAALEEADGGNLNPLIQLVARSVAATLQIYVNAQQEMDEISQWAAEIVSETAARVDDQRKLEYARWVHRMEHLGDAFARCAAQLNKLSQGQILIDVQNYPMIDQATWESLRAGTGATRTWFIRVLCRRDNETIGYIFFFGHHFWSEVDLAIGQIGPNVCLLLSEQRGQEPAVLLRDDSDNPISFREVLVIDSNLYLKRRIIEEQRVQYDRIEDPVSIAQQFFKEVFIHRLTQ